MQDGGDDDGGGGGTQTALEAREDPPPIGTAEPQGGSPPAPAPARRKYNPYDPRSNGMPPVQDVVDQHHECSFCLDPVFPRTDDKVSFNCCSKLYHVKCFVESAWADVIVGMKSRKNVRCPECSKPPKSRDVANRIRSEAFSSDDDDDDDDDDGSIAEKSPSELAKEKLRRDLLGTDSDGDEDEGGGGGGGAERTGDGWTRAKLTLQSQGLMGAKTAMKELRKPDVHCDFRWIKSNNITLDELLNVCTLEEIYKNKGVKSWNRLKQVGFRSDHLTILQNSNQIAHLVRYYKVKPRMLRKEMNITLKTLPDLHLSAKSMAFLGFDTHELCLMRFTKDHIKCFHGIPMGEWINQLGMSQFHLLLLKIKQKDFGHPLYLGQSWSVKGLCELLNLNYKTIEKLGLNAVRNNNNSGGGRRSRRRGGGGGSNEYQQQQPDYARRRHPSAEHSERRYPERRYAGRRYAGRRSPPRNYYAENMY